MRVICAAAALLVGTLVGSASAQSPEERPSASELVSAGQKLARDGKIAASLPLFREAAERAPSGERECLVALTYFRLKRHPEAWLHLERAAELGPRPRWCRDSVLVRDVERALATGGFAPVEITVDPIGARLTIASLAPDEELVAPIRVWLAWGTQRVRAEQVGYQSREVEVEVQGKESISVALTLDRVGGDEVGEAEPAEDAIDLTAQTPASGDRARSRWPWGVVTAGVAALAGGVGFHVAAARSRDAAADLYAGAAYEDELDRFRFRRNVAVGLYAASAVLTAVGVGLLMRSGGGSEQEVGGISVVPMRGGAAVWLRIDR